MTETPERLSTRIRRGMTGLTLVASFAALLAAMAFFMLRDDHPEVAIVFGKVVWVGLVAAAVGAGILTAAGIFSALAAPLEDEEDEPGGTEGPEKR